MEPDCIRRLHARDPEYIREIVARALRARNEELARLVQGLSAAAARALRRAWKVLRRRAGAFHSAPGAGT